MTVSRSKIRSTAALLVAECWEGGEVNVTQLAESGAHELGHDEWLDDSTHAVWDVAIAVAEEVGGLR